MQDAAMKRDSADPDIDDWADTMPPRISLRRQRHRPLRRAGKAAAADAAMAVELAVPRRAAADPPTRKGTADVASEIGRWQALPPARWRRGGGGWQLGRPMVGGGQNPQQ
ncbi:unnamed protein product [Prorocentrum cordatum]|uniref:Uncharacterized protein n=1 Tax=Prorocentrum cordatum TaxID=2364126 RepID=A0ABN9U220_9DINO|nr:unnamed protein product [Polarella glacialis]